MVIWLYFSTRDSNFCSNNVFYDFLFYSIFGMVYIFTHVTLNDGKTFWKYLFFYLILAIENAIATTVWIVKPDDTLKETLYFQPVACINFVAFFIGIMFMIVYYKVFHPSTGCKHRQREAVGSWRLGIFKDCLIKQISRCVI